MAVLANIDACPNLCISPKACPGSNGSLVLCAFGIFPAQRYNTPAFGDNGNTSLRYNKDHPGSPTHLLRLPVRQ